MDNWSYTQQGQGVYGVEKIDGEEEKFGIIYCQGGTEIKDFQQKSLNAHCNYACNCLAYIFNNKVILKVQLKNSIGLG